MLLSIKKQVGKGDRVRFSFHKKKVCASLIPMELSTPKY